MKQMALDWKNGRVTSMTQKWWGTKGWTHSKLPKQSQFKVHSDIVPAQEDI